MSKVKVEFEFDTNGNCDDVELLINYKKTYLTLIDLDVVMRNAIKYREDIDSDSKRLIESFLNIIEESGILKI